MIRSTRNAVLLATSLGMGATFAAPLRAQVTLTKVGDPIFEPVEFNMFSTPTSSFEEFLGVIDLVLPEPEHRRYFDEDGNSSSGTGKPHGPDFATEISEGIANAGFVSKTEFTLQEFEASLIYAFLFVPSDEAPIGPSPSSANGPILPPEIFPMTLDRDAIPKDGSIEFFSSPFEISSLSSHGERTDSNGNVVDFTGVEWDHLPVFFGTTSLFYEPPIPTGEWEVIDIIRDSSGNGWDVSYAFTLVPEPSSFVFALIGLAALFVFRRRRRA